MQYLIVIEKAAQNCCAFSPDVPGCIATGRTPEDAKANMREALEGHLVVTQEHGEPLPEPTSRVVTVHGYVVPIVKTDDGYFAEPPDLPGVAATAATPELVETAIREKVARRLRAGMEPPAPTTEAMRLEVEVPAMAGVR